MKTTRILLVLFISVLFSSTAFGQNSIVKAFDNIIDNSKFSITRKCSSERDPSTGEKVSQCDVYSFVIPEKNKNVISQVLKAFREDEKYAFYVSSGKYDASRDEEVVVGYGRSDKVNVADDNCDFYIASFLAPQSEDPNGINRYCYAISYKEENKKIVGKLVITYGTTPQYRQQQYSDTQLKLNQISGMFNSSGEPSWFSKFMTYINALPTGNYQQRSSLATKIYEMTQNIPDSVPSADLITAQDIVNTTLKKGYEEIVTTLLNSTSKNLGLEYEKRHKAGNGNYGGIYVK